LKNHLITFSSNPFAAVRLSGFHICHPPTLFRIIFPLIKLFLGERLRKRIRVHSGSEEKVQDEFCTYGLTKDVIPSELGGDVVVDLDSWLQGRKSAGK
jgi:hypothetical protein